MAESVSDDTHEYSLLKDLRLEIGVEDSSFSLCFWIYLMNPTPSPATIIGQVLNYSVSCFLRCFSFFLSIFFLFIVVYTIPVYPFFFLCVLEVFGCSSRVFWVWLLDLLLWVGYGNCNKFHCFSFIFGCGNWEKFRFFKVPKCL